MPKAYPEEFCEDVVRVARNRGPGVTLKQEAADFGVQVMTLSKWKLRADIDNGPETRNDQPGERGTAGGTSADQTAGAGERGPAPGRHLPVTGEPAGKRIYP
ncbi:hypothetical protein ACFRLW_49855, partial [Streptomyces sp. NPDC056728]